MAEKRGGSIGELNYILCGDDFLLDINRNYLSRDYYTDIITFPSAKFPELSADIFISTDRVKENAVTFSVSYDEELRRVIIHGILHLCGQGDKTEEESAQMRAGEDQALANYDATFKED